MQNCLSMPNLCKHAAGLAVAALTLMMIGCDRGPTRIPIKGTVTYKGTPVAEGTIVFIPKEAAKGTQEAAPISGGQYAIPAANGLMVGEYHVSVSAPAEPVSKPAPDTPPGVPKRSYKELLPEHYNRDSKLSIDVTADGKRVFDFQLD
jgi:hypothetical protein